jgi:Protein of unknown function (DUF2924)
MSLNIKQEVARMKGMTTSALREHFETVCFEPPRSRNRDWMIKKIAWRLQANEQGGLPERVRQRALAMADDADLRKRPPQSFTDQISLVVEQTTVIDTGRDPRLPPSGAHLYKAYKGKKLAVYVGEKTFEFNGATYGTLSAVAKAISGSHVNGFTFFGLKSKKESAQ